MAAVQGWNALPRAISYQLFRRGFDEHHWFTGYVLDDIQGDTSTRLATAQRIDDTHVITFDAQNTLVRLLQRRFSWWSTGEEGVKYTRTGKIYTICHGRIENKLRNGRPNYTQKKIRHTNETTQVARGMAVEIPTDKRKKINNTNTLRYMRTQANATLTRRTTR